MSNRRETAIAAIAGCKTGDDVATLLRTSRKYIDYHLFVRQRPYRTFMIPKKSGGERTIEVPPSAVLVLQERLAGILQDAYWRKRGSFGFCLGGGTVENARGHVGRRLVLNLDLADFFHSITFARI